MRGKRGEAPPPAAGSEFLLYQAEDGQPRVQVRLEDGTVWLTQAGMAALFQTTPQNITLHLRAIYREGELAPEATCKSYLQVRPEGGRTVARQLKHYSLDVILAVGYRVRSHRGTQFRQWATRLLREYVVKGFALDDERLKEGRGLGEDYFDELLERIRAIRASERRFYQKITDIYATSIDYDARHPMTQEFFATVQNKMHWAIHGHTAPELIHARADANKPHMGLTTWKNAPSGRIRKADVTVAKNYLGEEELSSLNLLVSGYLEFAEFQARSRSPMTMVDWRRKLDDFLKLSDRSILGDAGRISQKLAHERAEAEFARYEEKQLLVEAIEPSSDFDRVVEEVKRLESGKGRTRR